MSENVYNIVLDQLRLIRDDLVDVKDRIGAVESMIDGLTGVVIAFARYIHDIGGRVETLETKLGT